jgi:hypothetical protein
VLVDFLGFSGQPFDALFLFGSRCGIRLPPEKFLLTQQLSAIFEPRQVQCSDAPLVNLLVVPRMAKRRVHA